MRVYIQELMGVVGTEPEGHMHGGMLIALWTSTGRS